MASIQVVDRGRFVHACGGSVIERNLVLTAAHCMKFWQVRPMRIIFGTSYPTLDGPDRTERNIANFSTHPLYNTEKGKAYYDVAVVVLDEELDFSDRIRKVRLPTEAKVDGSHRNGHSATLTGWGEYEPKSGGTPELRHTQLEIFAEQYCNKTRFETDSPLVPNLFSSPVFCAGLSLIHNCHYIHFYMKPLEAQSKQVKNIFCLLGYHAGITGLSCNGDSGGPLVEFNSTEEHYVQVGIAQGGTCMSRTKPAIFSRIEDPDIFEFITKQFRNTIIPTTEATTTTTTTSIPATILRTTSLTSNTTGMATSMPKT